ncbi:MAG: YbaB/EbfC family nucleoid-associated protein [Treponema sp.]|nr:YbaB/EbfC family nucleoid-associated protein [Treponema sp.]
MNINPFDLIKQMSGFQEKLGGISATGSAAAGLVEIDVNGKLEVLAVRISPQAMDDIEMLQDLVMAAFTDGMTKVKEAITGQVGAMGFPGVM